MGEDGRGNRFCSKGSDPKISIINGRKREREREKTDLEVAKGCV